MTTTNFIGALDEIPAKHRGVLIEQLHLAATSATFMMRGLGMSLPGEDKVPTQAEVFDRLCHLTNYALEGYVAAAKAAQEAIGPDAHQRADDIVGEYEDDLFYVEVSGLSAAESDGYGVKVDLNLLYR